MSIYLVSLNPENGSTPLSDHKIILCGLTRVRRSKGQIVQWCDLYIGRRQNQGGWNLSDSKWRNPFIVGKDGTLDEVILKYYNYIRTGPLINDIEELRGKVLGCWCDIVEDPKRTLQERLDQPQCHGEVLLRLLYEKSLGLI